MTMPERRPVVGTSEAMERITNVSRRECHRTVPMKVLALELSGTGTASLRQALLDFGYEDCYHFAALHENPPDCEMWVAALKAKYEGIGRNFEREDWDRLLGHCSAVTDTPCVEFYRELIAAYPDAKVILQSRDTPQQWHASHMSTLVPICARFYTPTWRPWLLVYCYFAFWGNWEPIDEVMKLLCKYGSFKDVAQHGIQKYETYYRDIEQLVPQDRLLRFNVKEGWDPLSKFLEKDAPIWPFPRANERNDFNKRFDAVFAMQDHTAPVNVAKLVAGLSAVIAVAAGVYSKG